VLLDPCLPIGWVFRFYRCQDVSDVWWNAYITNAA
jgi:hypothetical protein